MGEGVISTNTPITIGLVVTLIGLVYWFSKQHSKTNQHEEKIAALEKEVGDLRDKQDLRNDVTQKAISDLQQIVVRIDVNVGNLLKKNP